MFLSKLLPFITISVHFSFAFAKGFVIQSLFVLNLAGYKFVSATYRLFKIPKSSKKEQCLVMYDGNITGSEEKVEFDAHYTFKV